MEEVIRSAGEAINFEALIIFPDMQTQIPLSYPNTYMLRGTNRYLFVENPNPLHHI